MAKDVDGKTFDLICFAYKDNCFSIPTNFNLM